MDKFYYAVYHCWEVDYYNATQWKEELICVFDTLKKAKEFKAKYEIKYDPDKVVWNKKRYNNNQRNANYI